MALSRRMNASRTKLSPGQRWRERRLPSVCWGRGRRITVEEDMAKTVKDLLAEANTTVPKLSPAEAAEKIRSGDVMVVDVRDLHEVRRAERSKVQ